MDGFGEVHVYVYNFLMILYKGGDIVYYFCRLPFSLSLRTLSFSNNPPVVETWHGKRLSTFFIVHTDLWDGTIQFIHFMALTTPAMAAPYFGPRL